MNETRNVPIKNLARQTVVDDLRELFPAGWWVNYVSGSFHLSCKGLTEEEVREIAKRLEERP